MKTTLFRKVLSVLLALTVIFAMTACQTTKKDESKAVTIAEWLDAKGEVGLHTMTVTVKSIVNPVLAVVSDSSGAEVNLFGVTRDNSFIDFLTLQLRAGDTLLIADGKYNEYEGSVEIKDAQLVEYRPSEQSRSIEFDSDFSNNPPIFVEDGTYDNDVYLTAENGTLIFSNCTFNANVTLFGGENAKVIFLEDCTFGENSKCVILSSVIEATIHTLLPKYIFFCNQPEVIGVNSCSVIANANQNITFNGKTYAIADSDYFVDENVGEDTIVDYTGQSADLHNVCVYRENGKTVHRQTAVQSAEE